MEGSSPRLNSHIVTATVPTAEMAAMIAEMSATILLSFPSDVFLNYLKTRAHFVTVTYILVSSTNYPLDSSAVLPR